ncbi:hypothetical protein QH494_20120 [Sphingomonas sp. AR_OL41]|uniref:hypothetical protein n=1 Tax=Sphingomonas sp. AR_OL41 TaxID=3042729 RepID=UPI00247FAE29|nr:hypothetical protein [Sphingomonas sp. AR_OL41]MDH7974502.1 hypothetical protein [Sphingomonas sp. AR_OL41]
MAADQPVDYEELPSGKFLNFTRWLWPMLGLAMNSLVRFPRHMLAPPRNRENALQESIRHLQLLHDVTKIIGIAFQGTDLTPEPDKIAAQISGYDNYG